MAEKVININRHIGFVLRQKENRELNENFGNHMRVGSLSEGCGKQSKVAEKIINRQIGVGI